MLVLTRPVNDDPNAEDPIHRENRRILRQVSKEKKYEKVIQKAFKLMLELPADIEIDSDLEGIHPLLFNDIGQS